MNKCTYINVKSRYSQVATLLYRFKDIVRNSAHFVGQIMILNVELALSVEILFRFCRYMFYKFYWCSIFSRPFLRYRLWCILLTFLYCFSFILMFLFRLCACFIVALRL